jgi:hypothetical protein
MSQYSFGDYLKEAFGWRWRVPLLGRMPINAIGIGAFAVAGIANPGFWLLGVALEVAYVIGLASSDRFQKVVQANRQYAQKETFEQKMEKAFNRLSPPSKGRYQRLYEACGRTLGITEALQEDDLASMRGLRSGGLTQLLAIFLRLLTSRELIGETLSRIDRVKVEEESRQLEERLAKEAPESPLRRALQGTLDIQKKRLENFHRAEQSKVLIDAELERIEQHVVLIGEEAATTGNAEDFTSKLDSVTSALSETNRWLEQNAALFGSMDSDPVLSGAAGAELPRLPSMAAESMPPPPPPPPPPPQKTRMR